MRGRSTLSGCGSNVITTGVPSAGSATVPNSPLSLFYPEYLGYAARLPQGVLQEDTPHRLKLWGTYDFLVGHPFLTKCLFFDRLTDAQVATKLGDQVDESLEKLTDFKRIRRGMTERGVDPFRVEVLDLGIAQQQARVRWLRRMIDKQTLRRAA